MIVVVGVVFVVIDEAANAWTTCESFAVQPSALDAVGR